MKSILLVPLIAALMNVSCSQEPKIDAQAQPNSPHAPRTAEEFLKQLNAPKETPKVLSITKVNENEFVGRFQIQQCELVSPDGKTVKTVIKFDTSTGESWSLRVPKMVDLGPLRA